MRAFCALESPSQEAVLPGENPVGGMTHGRQGGRGGVCKQNAVGGVLPNAPSTLCGFPTVTQGSAGLPVSLRACRTCTYSRSYFQSCPAWFRFSWLTYQARYVRVQ